MEKGDSKRSQLFWACSKHESTFSCCLNQRIRTWRFETESAAVARGEECLQTRTDVYQQEKGGGRNASVTPWTQCLREIGQGRRGITCSERGHKVHEFRGFPVCCLRNDQVELGIFPKWNVSNGNNQAFEQG
ncbi:hypothetical protein CEXT_372701 [Caerostris extrusa]|uniref:Uncharacterized protein n=1 Tax=Caerostris extrusa TaxID=172846 RepID=A0AAV4MPE9_CAEEX|nr:hypothetical protein CEXT_372701 [Caerostris extrusa]